MKRRVFHAFSLASILIFSVNAFAGDDVPYNREENVVYSVEHGIGLIMDVFTPRENANGLGIVDVLSGAWYSEKGQLNDHMAAKLFDTYCEHGYTVFMIRPGSRTKFTVDEMIGNLTTGVRYVREHSDEYGIDPNRLGITGASAGGHLTLLFLTSSDASNSPTTGIKAAAVFFPPTDFLDWNGNPRAFERLGDLLFAGGIEGHSDDEVRAKAESISPALNVRSPLPPVLLIHGDADPVVPLQQSQKMAEAIREAGGNVELVVKEGGKHPWPTISEEVEVMASWFDKQLAP